MDDHEEPTPTLSADVETEVRELMGLFDLPAFARRGQEVEYFLARLHDRCRVRREELLDMVHVRLRQWAGSVTGPDQWRSIFTESIEPLWALGAAEEPRWSQVAAPSRRQLAVARDLVAAVLRFNTRWARCLDQMDLGPINHAIDRYNRYYLIEKECVVGSARIAARQFVPLVRIDKEAMLRSHPMLPVPELCVEPRQPGRLFS